MRAITAFSEAVSSRRWKPRRREELRSEWHAATAVENDSDSDSNSDDEFDSDDTSAMFTIEASYSSVASDASSAAYRSGGVVRMPNSVASSLVLLEYPSLTHASSASNVLTASSVYSSDDDDEDATGTSNQVRGHNHQPLRHARVETPLLFPVLVVPQHVPRATEIQLFLRRIECVEITSVVERDDNVVYYVLDVYRHRQQNGIPSRHRRGMALGAEPSTPSQQRRHCSGHRSKYTRQLSSTSASNTDASSGAAETTLATHVRKPDYQIEHRYSSFARLRSHVWHIARKRHRRGTVCVYCDALVTFFSASDAQPNLRVKFTTNTEMRKALLRQFINDLLAAARADCSACTRSHRGVHPIPLLMKRFFHEQSGENFFS